MIHAEVQTDPDGCLKLSSAELYEMLSVLGRPNTSSSKPRRRRPSFFPLPAALDLEEQGWMECTITAVNPSTVNVVLPLIKGPVTIRLSTVKRIIMGEQAVEFGRATALPDEVPEHEIPFIRALERELDLPAEPAMRAQPTRPARARRQAEPAEDSGDHEAFRPPSA